jgi:hypothetical protein
MHKLVPITSEPRQSLKSCFARGDALDGMSLNSHPTCKGWRSGLTWRCPHLPVASMFQRYVAPAGMSNLQFALPG